MICFLAIRTTVRGRLKYFGRKAGMFHRQEILNEYFWRDKIFGRYSEQLPTLEFFNNASISNKVTVYLFIDERAEKSRIAQAKNNNLD